MKLSGALFVHAWLPDVLTNKFQEERKQMNIATLSKHIPFGLIEHFRS